MKENKKAVVLSSGGLDSSTLLAYAVDKYGKDNVVALSVTYGQRHVKELECARKIAEYYGVPNQEINLSNVFRFSNCNLLAKNEDTIPDKSYDEQIKENGSGRVSTYVPFRNGTLLSTAATFADSVFPDEFVDILYGAHADDAAGEAYADCSPKFVAQMNEAINTGTYKKIQIVAPFIENHKSDIVALGLKLGVPYELTWSCYKGNEKPCLKCGTCIDRMKAFEINNVTDPLVKNWYPENDHKEELYTRSGRRYIPYGESKELDDKFVVKDVKITSKISVTKEFSFEAAHFVPGHEGKCQYLHGHSYKLFVTVTGPLNDKGMVMDFQDLDKIVHGVIDKYDHGFLNDYFEMPTAEIMAAIIRRKVNVELPTNVNCNKIQLYETSKCCATAEGDI